MISLYKNKEDYGRREANYFVHDKYVWPSNVTYYARTVSIDKYIVKKRNIDNNRDNVVFEVDKKRARYCLHKYCIYHRKIKKV